MDTKKHPYVVLLEKYNILEIELVDKYKVVQIIKSLNVSFGYLNKEKRVTTGSRVWSVRTPNCRIFADAYPEYSIKPVIYYE